MNKQIVTRFAPSPTGDPHIGNVRTALYAWLFARQNEGEFLIRIEDTDQARSVEGSEEKILEMWKWLGFDYDQEIIRQSDRKAVYGEIANKLVEEGKAYRCFCTSEELDVMRKEQQARKEQPRYNGRCRNLSAEEVVIRKDNDDAFVIRLATPEDGETVVHDVIRGEVAFPNSNIDDLVLLKGDGFPTYHLAHVIDDQEQKVTHVIRAEEWLPSLPKHILIHKALEYELPIYAHLPMIFATDKSKLSKRHGAVSVFDFKDQGYLRGALINFMLLLGWHPKKGSEKEIFTREEMLEEFKLEDVQKSGAVFDYQKLDSMNSIYIRQTSIEDIVTEVNRLGIKINIPDNIKIEAVVNLEKERIKKLSELSEKLNPLLDGIDYDGEILVWKKSNKDTAFSRLGVMSDFLSGVSESEWRAEGLETKVKEKIEYEGLGVGDTLWPLRVSLSGQQNSPGPFEIMEVFGKEESLRRIKVGLEKISK